MPADPMPAPMTREEFGARICAAMREPSGRGREVARQELLTRFDQLCAALAAAETRAARLEELEVGVNAEIRRRVNRLYVDRPGFPPLGPEYDLHRHVLLSALGALGADAEDPDARLEELRRAFVQSDLCPACDEADNVHDALCPNCQRTINEAARALLAPRPKDGQ